MAAPLQPEERRGTQCPPEAPTGHPVHPQPRAESSASPGTRNSPSSSLHHREKPPWWGSQQAPPRSRRRGQAGYP